MGQKLVLSGKNMDRSKYKFWDLDSTLDSNYDLHVKPNVIDAWRVGHVADFFAVGSILHVCC